jgi:outer membrane receptor protein involved in Fe transport
VPLDPDRPFGGNSNGVINEGQSIGQTLSAEAAATGTFDLTDDISSATTVGAQLFGTETEFVECSGRGFASSTATACNAALTFDGASNKIENNEVGAFFQQRFGYRDYLYATGSVRVDDNSAFGDNLGAIVSPSANISAVLSDMPFWSFDGIDDFRLRFAWGRAAQAPAPFAEARTFRPVRVVVDGTTVSGISLLSPGNPDLAPERNEEFEIGFDGAALDNRLNFKLTYYDQRTNDAIVATNVAPSTGFSGARFVNIGEVTNNGIEAQLGGTVIQKDNVSLDLNLGFFTQNPTVTDLGDQPPILFGLGQDHLMFREGFAPGAYFGEVVSEAERDNNGQIVPGSVVFLPGNVGPDGGPASDAPLHRYLGNQAPSNEQNLSATLTLFGRLRVFTLFDRAAGHVKFDQSNEFRSPFIPNSSGSREFALRQAESTPEEQASMEIGDTALTPLFVFDADYVKWRELTIHYDFPPSLLSRVGFISALGLTIGGRNLATFSGYDGLDPELRYDGGRDSFNASEFFSQPPVRSFFARLNVAF